MGNEQERRVAADEGMKEYEPVAPAEMLWWDLTDSIPTISEIASAMCLHSTTVDNRLTSGAYCFDDRLMSATLQNQTHYWRLALHFIALPHRLDLPICTRNCVDQRLSRSDDPFLPQAHSETVSRWISVSTYLRPEAATMLIVCSLPDEPNGLDLLLQNPTSVLVTSRPHLSPSWEVRTIRMRPRNTVHFVVLSNSHVRWVYKKC